MTFDSKLFIENLTSRPGVYTMLDKNGIVLYIGKAKNLKNRVSSYFRSNLEDNSDIKLQKLVSKISDIQITVTSNEKEALLLENSLIKSHKPKYNIIFKDDKSYPYLFLSVNHEFPRLIYHRGPHKEPGRYFGPYPSSESVKKALYLLQKLFLVRQCDNIFFANRTRPCLQYQIKRCTAPCVGYISKEEYNKNISEIILFLEGKQNILSDNLVVDMEQASQNKNYERAAIVRDRISNLRQIQEQQSVFSNNSKSNNIDIIGASIKADELCIHLLIIRNGQILGSKAIFPKLSFSVDLEELLSDFIVANYIKDINNLNSPNAQNTQNINNIIDFPTEIIVPVEISDKEILEQILKQFYNRTISINHNVREQRAKWLKMAIENARGALARRLQTKSAVFDRFTALKEALGRNNGDIARLECFDVSHTMGEATVASCVVFDINGPVKADYRKFNITGITGGDDYAAMENALMRHFTKLKESNEILPDVLLIDGGKGQLSKAKKVLAECQLTDIIIIAVAKGPTRKAGLETLIVANNNLDNTKNDTSNNNSDYIIDLKPTSKALHLIQQIRDEAHRFAITGHRKQRGNKISKSPLEDIKGVGTKRRQALLTYFGGNQGLLEASIEAIARVPGISIELAKKIYTALHGE